MVLSAISNSSVVQTVMHYSGLNYLHSSLESTGRQTVQSLWNKYGIPGVLVMGVATGGTAALGNSLFHHDITLVNKMNKGNARDVAHYVEKFVGFALMAASSYAVASGVGAMTGGMGWVAYGAGVTVLAGSCRFSLTSALP